MNTRRPWSIPGPPGHPAGDVAAEEVGQRRAPRRWPGRRRRRCRSSRWCGTRCRRRGRSGSRRRWRRRWRRRRRRTATPASTLERRDAAETRFPGGLEVDGARSYRHGKPPGVVVSRSPVRPNMNRCRDSSWVSPFACGDFEVPPVHPVQRCGLVRVPPPPAHPGTGGSLDRPVDPPAGQRRARRRPRRGPILRFRSGRRRAAASATTSTSQVEHGRALLRGEVGAGHREVATSISPTRQQGVDVRRATSCGSGQGADPRRRAGQRTYHRWTASPSGSRRSSRSSTGRPASSSPGPTSSFPSPGPAWATGSPPS